MSHHNLYLFRHMISGRVVASGEFQVTRAQMAHTGTVRADHLVPFAVVTGLAGPARAQLLSQLAPAAGGRLLPAAQRSLPFAAPPPAPRARLAKGEFGRRAAEPAAAWTPWAVPPDVRRAAEALCAGLAAAADQSGAAAVCHWERDDFKQCVADAGNMWPAYVSHKPLQLVRNRYPLVPGLDRRTWRDVTVEQLSKE